MKTCVPRLRTSSMWPASVADQRRTIFDGPFLSGLVHASFVASAILF